MEKTITMPTYKEIKNRKTLPCKLPYAHDAETCNFAHGHDDLVKKPCRNETKKACLACGFGEDCFYWHQDESSIDYWMRQGYDKIIFSGKSEKEETAPKVIHTNHLAPWAGHTMAPHGHMPPHMPPYVFHPFPYMNGMMILNNQGIPPPVNVDSMVVPAVVEENHKVEPIIDEKPELIAKECSKVEATFIEDDVKTFGMEKVEGKPKMKEPVKKISLIFSENEKDIETKIKMFASLGFKVSVQFENN